MTRWSESDSESGRKSEWRVVYMSEGAAKPRFYVSKQFLILCRIHKRDFYREEKSSSRIGLGEGQVSRKKGSAEKRMRIADCDLSKPEAERCLIG